MRAPVHQGRTRLRADAAHRLQPSLVRREDGPRVGAEGFQQAVERDGPDVGQVVQHHERLALG